MFFFLELLFEKCHYDNKMAAQNHCYVHAYCTQEHVFNILGGAEVRLNSDHVEVKLAVRYFMEDGSPGSLTMHDPRILESYHHSMDLEHIPERDLVDEFANMQNTC
jgi:hypothetical protein